MSNVFHCLAFVFIVMALPASNHVQAIAQDPDEAAAQDTPAQDTPAAETNPPTEEAGETANAAPAAAWDRLIYVPFRELRKVFDDQGASVVLPYSEYLDLMQRAIRALPPTTGNQDVIITSSSWTAAVEKDLARVNVELKLNVLKEDGWAVLPIAFGPAVIGKMEPADGSVLLKGVGQGQYELLIRGAGQKTLTLELLATVLTSPEDRSFSIECPPTGISELVVTIPEPDQAVRITPLQVLLPSDGVAVEGKTVVKASLGATNRFEVHWNPRAGSKPVMDLLSSVTNQTSLRIEQGLLQARTLLNYEILRGELREVSVLVPKDARIIDVVSAAGRIRSWSAEAVGETHQMVTAELLVPATEKFQIEIQTERDIEGDMLQLIGRSEDGRLQGVHANGVVREAGRLSIETDPSLTTVVRTQTGVKQVEASAAASKSEQAAVANTWEFSGTSGQLVVQIKPVEPRLLVEHSVQFVFRDDELRLKSVLKYNVERAGVFQLSLGVPESLTIDNVSADGMSEFHVDKASGKIILSLTQKRTGAIEVTVQAHQAFDGSADNTEMELPILTPEGVERETGLLTAYAPEFLDVITIDEKLVGLFPSRDATVEPLSRLRHIASWSFTRRPVALFVRTTPRPAQIAASVGTTVRVEPEIVKQSAVIRFDIQNAGIDTLRVAVPEAVSSDVRFRMLSPGHTIQQRDKAAQADNGWVTWTLVLQEETTGTLQLGVDWDVTLSNGAAPVAADAAPAAANAGTTAGAEAPTAPERTLVVEPPRVLPPFTDDQAKRRRVVLTQTRGEIRLLRHESLSITADSQGETTEAIDVRELELMEQEGYLAYRYFAQPASATIRIRKHEIHEVAATVVSRGAIEVVTERQALASWRCRFRITTSERQRLRVDLPEGSDLQAPLLNDRRTTMEKATDVSAREHWEAYYVNVSRETTSDQEFLLTLLFRCPIVDQEIRPYTGQGGLQMLRLPEIGESGGSTVVQQLKLVLWAPETITFLGDPDLWTQEGVALPSITNPLKSPSAVAAAKAVDDWIDPQNVVSGDFPAQGSVVVYRAVGRQPEITVTWWSRSFLFWMISGTLVIIGVILRKTSWENRITLVLLAVFAAALFSLSGRSTMPQYVSLAWPGLLVVGGIWLTGLLIGQNHGDSGHHESPVSSKPSAETPVSATISPPTEATKPATSPVAAEADSPKAPLPGTTPLENHSTDDQAGGGK